MKQHKIIMRPAGFGMLPKRFISEGAEVIEGMTEAGLLGTIDLDGVLHPGLLSEDKTFVIMDVQQELIKMHSLLTCLHVGRVYRRLAGGVIDYLVQARLILCTQPFVPNHWMKQIFDIETWEPDIVMMKRVVEVEVK